MVIMMYSGSKGLLNASDLTSVSGEAGQACTKGQDVGLLSFVGRWAKIEHYFEQL